MPAGNTDSARKLSGTGADRLESDQVPHTALRWQLAVLVGAQLSVQGDQGPFQLTLIRIPPLASVQQGVPIGFQQRYEVFRHHRCSSYRPRHRQIEAFSQRPVMACAFDAIGSHADPVTQSQVVNHGLDCSGLAADGIQQRHPGAGHGDGHSQSWKSAPGAHINDKPALMRTAQFRLQRPEAVEHLVDPVVVPLHQTRQVDPAVPAAQQILKGFQLIQLCRLWNPAERLPERGSRQGVGHGGCGNSS